MILRRCKVLIFQQDNVIVKTLEITQILMIFTKHGKIMLFFAQISHQGKVLPLKVQLQILYQDEQNLIFIDVTVQKMIATVKKK